jgi:hypothetical protein
MKHLKDINWDKLEKKLVMEEDGLVVVSPWRAKLLVKIIKKFINENT